MGPLEAMDHTAVLPHVRASRVLPYGSPESLYLILNEIILPRIVPYCVCPLFTDKALTQAGIPKTKGNH